MDIFRAERMAQDKMANAIGDNWDKSFVLVGPLGQIECEWLDPFFGMFTIKGRDGFVMTKSIPADVDVLMSDDISPLTGH